MESKICKGPCGKNKPLTDFYKRKSAKDGRYAICKVCEEQRYTNWENKKLKEVMEILMGNKTIMKKVDMLNEK